MGDSDDLGKKIEEFNEFMLKQTAITFSMEGISKDLKTFLQKKISHNRTNLTQLASIISAIATSGTKSLKEELLKKNSPTYQLFDHVLKEIKITDVALDIIIQNMLNKEAALSGERTAINSGV